MSAAERRRYPWSKPANPELWQVSILEPEGQPRQITARLIDSTAEGVTLEVDGPVPVGAAVKVKGPGQPAAHYGSVADCSPKPLRTYHLRIAFKRDEPRSDLPHRPVPSDGATDYYETLELSPKASAETIHRVYRILAQRYHPDNRETGDETLFRQLLEAYRVLSDPEARAAYDVRHRSAAQERWRIFDRANSSRGAEGERCKRRGILALLYTKRVAQPSQPGMTVRDFEELLSCPREHLEFSLWYLRENDLISRGDNGLYAITVKGVDQAESSSALQPLREDRLLATARGDARPEDK